MYQEKLIERPDILKKIRPFYEDTDLIKVLTGMRRAGKSTLFSLIKNDLIANDQAKESHFLSINFENIKWRMRSIHDIHDEIAHFARQHSLAYVFLDEVQNLQNWEILVNSLRQERVASLFITGSNSKLLSGELATHLSGRYVSFEVSPFSFKEFYSLWRQNSEDSSIEKAFNVYLTVGGMPAWSQGYFKRPPEAWQQYLTDLFDAIFIKDIISRHQIRDVELFRRVLYYLFDQIAHPVSIASLSRFLKSEGRSPSKETLANFIDAACEAFIFEKVNFQDTEGKKILAFNHKFFAADHGLRQALFLSNPLHVDQILENIVAIELRRRGWQLSVGRISSSKKEAEVDFIARKHNEVLYVQVTYLLASLETEQREFEPLLSIPDNFPKMVLSLDPILRPRQGIEHKDLRQWLLEE